MCVLKGNTPFIMTLNWNHSLIHSNESIQRGPRRVYDHLGVDQSVFIHLQGRKNVKMS